MHKHILFFVTILFAFSVGIGGTYLASEFGDIGMASIIALVQDRTVTLDSFAEHIERDNKRFPESISIGWVGDIAPHPQAQTPGLEFFVPLAPITTLPDLMAGNLEGVITYDGTTAHEKCRPGTKNNGCWQFVGDTLFLNKLFDAGFDVLNMANNHSGDGGPDGKAQTIAYIAQTGMTPAGAHDHITYRTHGKTKIAFIGVSPFSESTDIDDTARIQTLVAEADTAADIVIVFFHAGAEGVDKTRVFDRVEWWNGWRRGNSYRMAHAAIDSGADLVLGSGPHTLRGMELYKDRLIAYSLANFAGNNTFNKEGDLSLSAILIARIDATTGAFISENIVSARMHGPGIPVLDPAQTALSRIQDHTKRDFPESFKTLFQ